MNSWISDSTVSMSSSIIEWLSPGYSLNFALGIRDAMSRAASTWAHGSPVRFITNVVAHARAGSGDVFKGRPIVLNHRDHLIVLLPRLPPRMISRCNPPSLGAPD